MKKMTIYCLAFFTVALLLASCRSSKTVVEEEKKDSLVQTSNVQVDIQTTTETKTNEDDSTEVFTVTIITEYDTAKADSTGKSPVLRQTQITESKRKGSKKAQETTTKQNISATKEESANQVTQSKTRRENTKTETKQPLYYAYILYGVALVILMAILAYWVFTKYRAARP